MKTNVLKPGLLVSLKTTVRGGVTYSRNDLEPEHKTESGELRARWETVKEIQNPAEFEAATVARNAARSKVLSVCCASSFGLLCPSDKEPALEQAIKDARAIAAAHNAAWIGGASVDVFVLVGRVAQDDAEAARAIGAEVRDMIATMEAGIKQADPAAIREAANKARAIESMLSPELAGSVADAIAEARKAAREIVKRVEKAGESAATVVAQIVTDKLQAARFAFLDLEEGATAVAPDVAARPVELSPASEMPIPAPTVAQDARTDAGPVVNGEQFPVGYTRAAAEYEQNTRPAAPAAAVALPFALEI